ncbi:MAG: hypothetical protein LC747_01375 [Acidobacteria bacterium]|nr:hypothetical protein [Acidobacteriota bacterium]
MFLNKVGVGMSEAKKKSDGWVFGLYFGIVSTVLRLIFADGMGLSRPLAGAASLLITLLVAYPLFLRGAEVRPTVWNLNGRAANLPGYVIYCGLFAGLMFLLLYYVEE